MNHTKPISPELAALLEEARRHVMSPEESEAQRQSWVRGEMAIGTDSDEELYRRELFKGEK
jgi:hypothetical protein